MYLINFKPRSAALEEVPSVEIIAPYTAVPRFFAGRGPAREIGDAVDLEAMHVVTHERATKELLWHKHLPAQKIR